MNLVTRWNLAAAALLVLVLVPSAALFLASLCLVRRRHDPARTWLAYYKAAFGLFAAGTVLFLLRYLLDVIHQMLIYEAPDPDAFAGVYMAQVETGVVGFLFAELAAIALLLALVSLGKAISLVAAAKETPGERIAMWGAYGIAALLTALNLVSFALGERLFAKQYKAFAFGLPDPRVLRGVVRVVQDMRNVQFAMLLIQLLFNVAVLVKSVVVAIGARPEPRLAVVR